MIQTQTRQRSARETLEAVAHRKVRYLAAKTSAHSDALFEIVKERIPDRPWTVDEWDAVVDELDRCDLTVREWLALEDHDRRKQGETHETDEPTES